jgi:tungstate transport system ATP-binding protein
MLNTTLADETDQAVVRLVGVSMRARATTILRGIDLEIRPGPPTIVMGPNGSGKTTLLRLMMGLCAPSEGRMEFMSRAGDVPMRRAIVLQKPVMLRRSTAANVRFALKSADLDSDQRTVAGLLEQVGLSELAKRAARRLSGGEQQRLALARALARKPDILFLDEPTANLDPAQTKAVEEIVTVVAASGVKVVMSTHDLGQARRLAGEVVFLVGGRVVERGPAETFFSRPASLEASRFMAGELII